MDTRRTSLDQLVEIMARLRAPDGCPWDREQTLESLKAYLIEETYEVLEVMDGAHPAKHREELGDLLLQIVFQAQIAKENGDFDVYDVAQAIVDKMIRRHPHVFGEGERALTAGDAYSRWERIKQEERKAAPAAEKSALDGVPRHLPALLRALRVTDKASRLGFDWPDIQGVEAKMDEEWQELEEAIRSGDKAAVEAELGDVLFTMVNLSRFLDVNPEEALRRATERFQRRFKGMEGELATRGRQLGEVGMEELNVLWERAKEQER